MDRSPFQQFRGEGARGALGYSSQQGSDLCHPQSSWMKGKLSDLPSSGRASPRGLLAPRPLLREGAKHSLYLPQLPSVAFPARPMGKILWGLLSPSHLHRRDFSL